MNGLSALDWLKMMRNPIIMRTMMTGASHHAFLTRKKPHSSPSNDLSRPMMCGETNLDGAITTA